MKHKYYGSLHTHTEMSNFKGYDCINKIDELIDYAIELGHEVVAITDHDTIAAAPSALKKYKKVKENNPDFKVILGNEIYLCRNGLNASNYNKSVDRFFHFILLAKNRRGFEQISEISTRAWLRSYSSRGVRRVPTYYQDLADIVEKEQGNIIATSACLGSFIGTNLMKYQETNDVKLLELVKKWCLRINEIFGQGNFYLELQPSASAEQTYVNQKLVELSDELSIPYIISTDAHYLKREDAIIHKTFLRAQQKEREVDSFYATTYMMDTQELEKHLSLTEKELQIAYLNTKTIKDQCEDFTIDRHLKMPKMKWKQVETDVPQTFVDELSEQIQMLPTFLNSPHEADVLLAKLLIERFYTDKSVCYKKSYEETNMNLDLCWKSSEVNDSRWSIYFLNLQNILELCWEAGSLVGPARGSAGGFYLMYLLDVIQINPLEEEVKTMAFRFLNPDRVSPLDVDCDIESSKREAVLKKFREEYGEQRVANVLTVKTEKTRSAILDSARGLGISSDEAGYLASLIKEERGELQTLKQSYYGDESKNINPNKEFHRLMSTQYQELWKVASHLEGLIVGCGVHAGGVVFVDEHFTKSTALMRSPSGQIMTQYTLHELEDVGNIKVDILSVNALDRMHICLDLLIEYGYIAAEPTLKETYKKYLNIYDIQRTQSEMWQMVNQHQIPSLFQMEKQSGITGINLIKPKNVSDLTYINATMRLMASEKGAEQPLTKYARFKENINNWYREMDNYGLTSEEQAILIEHLKDSYGLCVTQEQMMLLLLDERIVGWDLQKVDTARKSIAKKNMESFLKIQDDFFESASCQISKPFAEYVWNVLISMQRSYAFCAAHGLAYTLVALQEMYLYSHYPSVFWNTACLIADSGGTEEEDEQNEEEEIEEVEYENSFEFDEEEDVEEVEVVIDGVKKKVKKAKPKKYGKISAAIGALQSKGVNIVCPDINISSFTFTPDVKSNQIYCGFNSIVKIGNEIVNRILEHRPYTSIQNFLSSVKVNKTQMVNLIKSGAFDSFGDRYEIMKDYILSVSDQKKTVNMRNLQMMIAKDMIPHEFESQVKDFNFTKYLKAFKQEDYYDLDGRAFAYYEADFDIDELFPSETAPTGFKLSKKDWDRLCKMRQLPLKKYVATNVEALTDELNQKLFNETWEKYCSGSISKWEMDSISYYAHEHELAGVDKIEHNLVDFTKLPNEPPVERIINIKGKEIPLYKIQRIAGTVLDKDRSKKTVTLLTTSGVVVVKIFGDVYTHYDKQLSIKDPITGKKKVVEKSWFTRGNKIVVSGIRREEGFLAKKYSRTPWQLVTLITEVDAYGNIKTQNERVEIE